MKRAASSSVLRNINRSTVLDLFRFKDSISVIEIVRRLNMRVLTAKHVVEDLMTRNLVRSVEITRESYIGRPSSYEFNRGSHVIIALDINATEIRGALIDLSGEIQGQIQTNRMLEDRANNLDWIYCLIARLLFYLRNAGQVVLGIVVGIPGMIVPENGVVNWAPNLSRYAG